VIALRNQRRARRSQAALAARLALGRPSPSAARRHVSGSARSGLHEIHKLCGVCDRASIAGLIGRGRIRSCAGRQSGAGFARGTEVELTLDADQFTGTGAFLLASVLDVFLGLYTAANSFTQTVARTRQGQGVLKRWPPRAGEMPLL
jgi:type VI secretion system protein ImpG